MSKANEKITPLHDFSWYVKWGATIFIMSGLVCRATGFSTPLDILLTFNGTVGWFIVGWLWRDRALMIMNAIAAFLLLVTLAEAVGV